MGKNKSDDEALYQEYLESISKNIGSTIKPTTMEDTVKNHNDWWDSLSEEEKQKLYEEKSGVDDEYINYWLKKDNESK